MSTSTSTSSSSSSEESSERRDDDGGGGGGGEGGGGGGGFEGPSTSRSRRRRNGSRGGVWPALFLEALASQVAIDASRSLGRLAAAPTLSNLFQVCTTWRTISGSELLWENLTRRIWRRNFLRRDNWRDEFIFCHRTANNFSQQSYTYTTLPVPPLNPNNNNNEGHYCQRLALSDHYLAAGFSNGAVHLYHLPNRLYVSTFYPQHRDRLGRFPSAISGIILSDTRIVFASLDGDIHVVIINQLNSLRLAYLGDVVNDGALVDFAGCNQWWVGLYAGVPGRAFHVWNSVTEDLVFVGGSLTDQEAVTGWHMLTDQLMTDFVGRIRVTSHETAMACTSFRVMVFDLRNHGIILGEEEFQRGLIVGSVDASDESFLAMDVRGLASVRQVGTMEEVCRFTVRGASRRVVLGCMNGGYGIICIGGVLRVWNIEHGQYLYDIRERIGEANAVIADERLVVACSSDSRIHLWDFGAYE